MSIGSLVPWRWGSLRGFDDDRSLDSLQAQMDSLHRNLDRLFADAWNGNFKPSLLSDTWAAGKVVPSLDVVDEDKAFRVTVELPGMTDKDVAVTVDDRTLTIRGEKKHADDPRREERGEGEERQGRVSPRACLRLVPPHDRPPDRRRRREDRGQVQGRRADDRSAENERGARARQADPRQGSLRPGLRAPAVPPAGARSDPDRKGK
jgi:HSP20 family molecular chaperone IbpA